MFTRIDASVAELEPDRADPGLCRGGPGQLML
ncbi:hypothetical protein J2X28_001882 [Kocuria rhizophila]|nr:hypothetical protein [Kocuria rhizophila]